MTYPDYRALCAELVSAWDCAPDSEDSSGYERLKDAVEAARAALAEVAVGPSDEELLQVAADSLGYLSTPPWDFEAVPMSPDDVLTIACAVLNSLNPVGSTCCTCNNIIVYCCDYFTRIFVELES